MEAREDAILAANQSAGFGADPQALRAIFPDANDAAAIESGGVVGIENGKAHAVEPNEAVERGEPEIAVVRLGHRDDGILGKALVGLPRIDEIARRGAAISRSAGAERGEEQRKPELLEVDSQFSASERRKRGRPVFASLERSNLHNRWLRICHYLIFRKKLLS